MLRTLLTTKTTPTLLRLTNGTVRYAHTVRIILTANDETTGGYKGDILTVKAGYMRNYLYPGRKAVYATKENLVKFEEEIQKAKDVVLAMEAEDLAKQKLAEEEIITNPLLANVTTTDSEKREMDKLLHYLKSKTLLLKRQVNADGNTLAKGGDSITPEAINSKLARQLQLVLEEGDEIVVPDASGCNKLGEIEGVKIVLSHGGEIPLRVNVIKR